MNRIEISEKKTTDIKILAEIEGEKRCNRENEKRQKLLQRKARIEYGSKNDKKVNEKRK